MTQGRLVLCGSGEFTAAMEAIDREILDGIGARVPAVAIVPTAAGQEDTPAAWIAMGSEHFRRLGAEPVGVPVLARADTEDARWSEAVGRADWIYFSGGHPSYAVDTLRGTPFWGAVLARLRAGAVVAGSSAGAMMLGGRAFDPRGRDENGLPLRMGVRDALGLLPRTIVAPHFDIVPEPRWREWAALRPAGEHVLGIDEDTALLQQHEGWSVRGRGTVRLIGDGGAIATHTSGARLDGLVRVVLP